MKKTILLLALFISTLASAQVFIVGGQAAAGNTDSQQMTLAGNTLTLQNGGTVNLSPYLDNTDGQTVTDLSLAGNILSITLSGGNTRTVDLSSISLQDNAVTSAKIANGAILEEDLNSTVQTKLNSVGGGDSLETLTQAQFNALTQPQKDAFTGYIVGVDGNVIAKQTLSIVGQDLTISEGNTVTLPSGGGSSNANVLAITSLADLQAATANKILSIEGAIDIVNTNVTLPLGVYIKDGGGSLKSTGTGKITTLAGTIIDYSVLNYQLNFDVASVGRLYKKFMFFEPAKWNIVQNVDNTTTGIANRVNINKALSDFALFGAGTFELDDVDFYTYGSRLTQDQTNSKDNGILIPSNTHFKMSNKTNIRHATSNHFSPKALFLWQVVNVKITGGNLYGDRDTHNYAPINDENGFNRDSHETGNGLMIVGSQSVEVDNVKFYRHTGDALMMQGVGLRNADGTIVNDGRLENKNIKVTRCVFDGSRRNGVSVTDGGYIVFENNDFINTGNAAAVGAPVGSAGVAPKFGIDLEAYREVTYTRAEGVFTLTTNATNGETMTIGTKTYTFQTTLTNVNGNVLIGGTINQTLDNIESALGVGAGNGTTYAAATTAHPDVRGTNNDNGTLTIYSLNNNDLNNKGWAGNSIATTETFTNGSFGSATLTGGFDNLIQYERVYEVVLHNNRFFNNFEGDIDLFSCSNVTVTNNTLSNRAGSNVSFNVIFKDNDIIAPAAGVNTSLALGLSGKERNGEIEAINGEMTGNFIKGFDKAIAINGRNVNMSNNRVESCNEAMYFGNAAQDIIISNNILKGTVYGFRNFLAAGWYKNIIIDGNYISGGTLALSMREVGTNPRIVPHDIIFKNNEIKGNIDLESVRNVDFINNKFNGSLFSDGTSNNLDFIDNTIVSNFYGGVWQFSGATINNIRVMKNFFDVDARFQAAIFLNNTGTAYTSNVRISDNYIKNKATLSDAIDGIKIVGHNGVEIINNSFESFRDSKNVVNAVTNNSIFINNQAINKEYLETITGTGNTFKRIQPDIGWKTATVTIVNPNMSGGAVEVAIVPAQGANKIVRADRMMYVATGIAGGTGNQNILLRYGGTTTDITATNIFAFSNTTNSNGNISTNTTTFLDNTSAINQPLNVRLTSANLDNLTANIKVKVWYTVVDVATGF